MTESVATILKLINETLATIQHVNTSVGLIAEDSKKLGEEIQVVDTAMGQVESSNKNMVDNMKQVQDIMLVITESVKDSADTTTTMLSKYEETARNVINIETVVGQLVEELGAGGFMSQKDIEVGMKVIITESGSDKEYHTEVAEVEEGNIYIEASRETGAFLGSDFKKKKYQVRIVVGNVVYVWNDVAVKSVEEYYQLMLENNPKVINRRKHPRLPMSNTCEITLKSNGKTYSGHMVNISAGGFAFKCTAQEFASARGEVVKLKINNFMTLDGKELTGVIIRSSDNDGTYIVGCRMPEDNAAIMKFVKARMGE